MTAVRWIPAHWIAGLLIVVLLSTDGLRASPASATAPIASIVAAGARTPVRSSMLAAVAYDGSKKILELEFRSGSIYQYLEVPESVFQQLLNAESKGRFYNRQIKKHFKSQKVGKP